MMIVSYFSGFGELVLTSAVTMVEYDFPLRIHSLQKRSERYD